LIHRLAIFLSTYVCLTPALCSDPEIVDFGTIFSPLTFAVNNVGKPFLDIMLKPLHTMSCTPNLFNPVCDAQFIQAIELITRKDPQMDQLQEAHRLLNESAIGGHPYALYHMGRLMLAWAEGPLEILQRFVKKDIQMGVVHLNVAEKYVPPARKILNDFDDLNLLVTAMNLAKTDVEGARGLANIALKNNSPHGKFFLAEAMLNKEQATCPWLYTEEENMYSQRTKALLMLKYAATYNVSEAHALMAKLDREDQVFVTVCQMIMENADKKIVGSELISAEENEDIEGLCLGDAGFQFKFIDLLCEKKEGISGVVLTEDHAEFLKRVMYERSTLLFQVFNHQSNYAGSKQLNLGEELSKLKKDIVGKKIKCVPDILGRAEEDSLGALVTGYYERKKSSRVQLVDIDSVKYDFTNFGTMQPITAMEADAAWRMIILAADDFNIEKDYFNPKDQAKE
jgi:hypothetical protein